MLHDTPYGKFWAETPQALTDFITGEGLRIYTSRLYAQIYAHFDSVAQGFGLKDAATVATFADDKNKARATKARRFADWRSDVLDLVDNHITGLTTAPEDINDFIETLPAFDLSRPVPYVTMRQARRAMLGAGILDDVKAAVAALPANEKEEAVLEWENAERVTKDSVIVDILRNSLGLTNQQLRALFETASTL